MKKLPRRTNAINLIGQRLKYEMKSRGIHSAELAKRADVKISFIYDVISGKSANPSTVKLARVAQALDITLANLVDSLPTQPAVQAKDDDYITIPTLTVKPVDNNQPFCFLHSWITRQLRINTNDLRMFVINSDSMEPALCQNDNVLVDIGSKDPTRPGIFVLFDGYGLSVKRVERVMNSPVARLRIISDNPQYSIYESSPADAGIMGRVVWFSRGM